MSTFDGIIKEYPLISIDNFLACNFNSTVFFLSHCHTDHMRGLYDTSFFQLLENRPFCNIYVSEVSKHLLINDYRYYKLKNYIVSLALEEPAVIVVPDETGGFHSKIAVTLLPAGHCPGSVMFLIEGDNGRVLYTGDFRLPVGGSARLTKLHDENGKLKPLDSLYLDTTFCKKKFMHFPPREKCLSSLFHLIEQWVEKGPNYMVAFSCPAQYNYEYLFVELHEKFKVKIHVSDDRLPKYKGIENLEDVVTTVPNDTQIHACFYREPEKVLERVHFDEEPCFEKDGKPCVDIKEKPLVHINEAPCGFHTSDRRLLKILIIRPCAMSFSNSDGTEEHSYYDYNSKVHKICFSSHSSLSEVRDMVHYLKPKQVYPNVVRKQTEEEILDLIYEDTSQNKDSSDQSQPLLGTLNIFKSDSSHSAPGSLPFFDESYKNQQLNACGNAAANSVIEQVDQLFSDCESIEVLEASEEHVSRSESGKKGDAKPSEKIQVPKDGNTNELKWNCPLFSNDENLDPNSSFGSSQDIFEINSTPGDSQELTPKLSSSPESKTVLKSSSPKDAANLVHYSPEVRTVKNNSMEHSVNYSVNVKIESKNVLDQIVEETSLKSNTVLSERTIFNPLELLFSETSSDGTPSNLISPCDFSKQCLTKNSFTNEHTKVSQQCEEKPVVSCLESNIQEKQKILVHSSNCHSENSNIAWGHSKFENDECSNPNSLHVSKENENQAMQVVEMPKEKDSDSEYQSSMEDLRYFCKLIDEVTECDRENNSDKIKKSVSPKLLACDKGVDMTISSAINKPPLNSNSTKTSEVLSTPEEYHSTADFFQQKFSHNQNKISEVVNTSNMNIPHCSKLSSPPYFVPKSQELNFKSSYPNPPFSQSSTTINIQPSQSYFKPNPLKDISTSKFEKSLIKSKEKAVKKVENDDSDDIVILRITQNKQPSNIEVIDLSSDDSSDEISIMQETSNLKNPNSNFVLNFNDNNRVENLNISESLLTTKNISKQSSDEIFINRIGNKTNKRKSDENEYMFIKSLKTGTSDGPFCYFEDAGFDSTPEDLPILNT